MTRNRTRISQSYCKRSRWLNKGLLSHMLHKHNLISKALIKWLLKSTHRVKKWLIPLLKLMVSLLPLSSQTLWGSELTWPREPKIPSRSNRRHWSSCSIKRSWRDRWRRRTGRRRKIRERSSKRRRTMSASCNRRGTYSTRGNTQS